MNSNKKILLFVLTFAVLTALLMFCSLRVVFLARRIEALENIIQTEQLPSFSESPIISQGKNAPPDESKHEVLSVIDGDTIIIKTSDGGLKVRIIGIDTPETVHPFKSVESGGLEASNRAKELLTDQIVVIHYDPNPNHGKWDKYKRLLVYIDLSDNSDYGLIMIQEGLARAYLKYPFSRQETYFQAEQMAKENKVGIWSQNSNPNHSKRIPELPISRLGKE